MMQSLKKRRKALGLTQGKLAKKLGVSLPTIVNWEGGKSSPRGRNLVKVEKFLTLKSSSVSKPLGRGAGSGQKKVVADLTRKVGRPRKVLAKRSRVSKSAGVASSAEMNIAKRLSVVARDLGFVSVDDMVSTIVRKHKIGQLVL